MKILLYRYVPDDFDYNYFRINHTVLQELRDTHPELRTQIDAITDEELEERNNQDLMDIFNHSFYLYIEDVDDDIYYADAYTIEFSHKHRRENISIDYNKLSLYKVKKSIESIINSNSSDSEKISRIKEIVNKIY